MDRIRLLFPLCLIFAINEQQVTNGCRHQWRLRARAIFSELFEAESEELPKLINVGEDFSNIPILRASSHRKSYGEDDPFFRFFEFYTDLTGCYEEGDAQNYRGAIDITEGGIPCSKWSVFTSWLSQRIRTAEERKVHKIRENLWKLAPHVGAEEDAEIKIANNTIKDMQEKGLLNHRFCRDPDNTGRPWCFVETKTHILWQTCAVPKCTPCWRIRQRAIRFAHAPPFLQKIWIPSCDFRGAFASMQCWSSYCWCSDTDGQLIKGTLTRKSDGKPLCDKTHRNSVTKLRVRNAKKKNSTQQNSSATDRPPVAKSAAKQKRTRNRGKRCVPIISMEEWITRLFHGVQSMDDRSRNKEVSKTSSSEFDESGHQQSSDPGAQKRDKERREHWEDLSRHEGSTVSEEMTLLSRDRKRKYECVVHYTVINTLRCVTVNVPGENPAFGRNRTTRRCFIARRLRVRSWSCTRNINETSRHVINFTRVPLSSSRSRPISNVFNGVSYICRNVKTTRKGRKNSAGCRRSAFTLTNIYLKNTGEKKHICIKSWRRWKLVKSKCIEMRRVKEEAGGNTER